MSNNYEYVKTITSKSGRKADVYTVNCSIGYEDTVKNYSVHPVGVEPTRKNNVFGGILTNSIAKCKSALDVL